MSTAYMATITLGTRGTFAAISTNAIATFTTCTSFTFAVPSTISTDITTF